MNNKTKNVNWKGNSWLLDSRRVLIHEKEKKLIFSDLHIGYYATLRKEGYLLPTYDSIELQNTIKSLKNDYKDYHWIIAGDIKHSHGKWENLSEDEKFQIKRTFNLLQNVKKVTLLIGNHDLGLREMVEESNYPFLVLNKEKVANCTIVHNSDYIRNDSNTNQELTISGHVHPYFKTPLVANRHLPVFAFGKTMILLPAFNNVAGGFAIQKYRQEEQDWKIFGIVKNTIQPLGPVKAWISSNVED